MDGQWRAIGGMGTHVLGWDMAAAFALGDALGVNRTAIAVFLPDIEAVAARKLNERMGPDEG